MFNSTKMWVLSLW